MADTLVDQLVLSTLVPPSGVFGHVMVISEYILPFYCQNTTAFSSITPLIVTKSKQ